MQPELSQQSPQPRRAYRVPRHPAPVDLRLDGNEGQVVCDDIVQALEGMKSQSLREYPSTRGLEEKIAELYQVSSQQVLVTAGADDGLLRCLLYTSPSPRD